MSGRSEFELEVGRYLTRNGKVLVFVMAEGHAEPLLDEIRKYERGKGAEYAANLLIKMESSGLSNDIRLATNLDAIKMAAEIKRQKDKDIRGSKYVCSCGTSFYDLEQDNKCCPNCKAPKSECKKLS